MDSSKDTLKDFSNIMAFYLCKEDSEKKLHHTKEPGIIIHLVKKLKLNQPFGLKSF